LKYRKYICIETTSDNCGHFTGLTRVEHTPHSVENYYRCLKFQWNGLKVDTITELQ